jgi:hypothetical protein
MGYIYHSTGRSAQAEVALQRALKIREEAFGPNHPAVGDVLRILAMVNRKLGKNLEAVKMEERAAGIQSRSQCTRPSTLAAVIRFG